MQWRQPKLQGGPVKQAQTHITLSGHEAKVKAAQQDLPGAAFLRDGRLLHQGKHAGMHC